MQVLKRLAVSLLCLPLWAYADTFKISEIKVEGLQRLDVGTVYNDLPVRVGDVFNTDDSGLVIRDLFKSGFFSDVALARDGTVLIVTVKERPTIGRLTIDGNDAIDTKDLMEGLENAGLAEGMTYVPSVLAQVEQELSDQYYSNGQYGLKITSEVTELPRNRVDIAIKIDEGDAAKIRRINIVGNHAFSTRKLLKRFTLTTPNLMTWLNKNDQYSKQKLSGDLENLRSFYLDRGYMNFEITSTQVSLSPDMQDVLITVNIKEGSAYTISGFKFAGEIPVPEEDLRELIMLEPGELFSRKKLLATQNRMVQRLGDDGYAFADVNPVPVVNEENKTVEITFYVNPKKQVYVRRINFHGNYLSKDEVLRREMRQFEGSLASTKKIQRSKNNLNLLGYYKNVEVDTVPVPGTDDEVDLEVTVEEQLSGQLTGGVGFSQVDGFVFNAGLKQDNFLGSGNMVDFLFNHSKSFTSYRVGYDNPFYTMDGVSRGFDAFYSETNMAQANISNYTRDIWGGDINFGIPLSEVDRINAGLGYQNIDILTSNDPDDVSIQVASFLEEYGNHYNEYLLSAGWSHNTLDRVVFPTHGLVQGLSFSIAAPLSELEYYKAVAQTRYYFSVLNQDKATMLLRANAAYGNGYGNTEGLPFFENFFAGGTGSVRGFTDNSLGPRDSLDRPLGGNFRLVGTSELIFPVPFIELESVRLSLFADGGNVYNTEENVDLGELRYSAGVSIQWVSPLGPFVFSVAAPLNKEDGDETQIFQFNLGNVF
ncbi:MAG: outer membrane protein assembly factor BamA [Gammaproteobacteria bacterium]